MASLKKLPLAYIKEENGKHTAVYPALKNRTRPAGQGNPEEAVRLDAYNELITKYGYPPERIDIEVPVLIREDESPRSADIVVFDDKERKRPFIVVETKKPNREDGEKQGQRYATILRAVYVLWTNGSDRSASVIVDRYPEAAAPIRDIPSFGGQPQYSITDIEPFKDDRELATAVRKCHRLIRSLSNLKADAAFTEFLKILLVKFEDESKDDDYGFQVFLRGEPPQTEPSNETAQRIRLLFKLAVESECEVSSVFQDDDDIALTNDCIAQIVTALQRFSFSATPVDQKGRAFESFLSGDMRQEFKEFMTPRPVVEAVVRMAQPDASMSVLDPCCGSAAFLIYCLNYVRQQIQSRKITSQQKIRALFGFALDRLWGFDASQQMSAVARINMLVNEDGRAHIHQHDSLFPRHDAPLGVREKLFDLVLTNPPFGKRITQPSSLLEGFEMTKNPNGRLKKGGFLTEVLFLERNLQWLKPGGLMFIVLPDSVLGNSTLGAQREYIERQAQIVAIISLSSDTFGPSGAKSKTSVLVLQKRAEELVEFDPEESYDIFVAHVEHVGYDFTGRATSKNDLGQAVSEYLDYKKGGRPNSRVSDVINRQQLGKCWVAQPHVKPALIETKGSSWRMGDICQRIFTGKTAPRSEYRDSGVHVMKVGNLTGRGIDWGAVERQYVDPAFANQYSSALLQKGDILFTSSAHGPKWIGLKVDVYDGAPDHIGEPVLACAEIMVCRLNPALDIDPFYLLLYMRSSAGYLAIQKCIRGQSGHVYPGEVQEIVIPKPGRLEAEALTDAMNSLGDALSARRSAAALELRIRALSDTLFPSGARKPIIAT